jgi:predicted neuraminidase
METHFRDSLSESDFLYNPQGGAHYCHSATILETPTGELLSVWYAYPEKENVDASLILARRPANGKTWEKSRILLERAAYSLGNPVLCQTPDGAIFLFYVALRSTWWNSAALNMIVSHDDGHSWSHPTSMGSWQGMMIRHSPVCLPNTDLLLPAYDETKDQTVLLRAARPYTQWSESYRFEEPGLIQPVIITDPRGNLDIYFRAAGDHRHVWRSTSKDTGATWAPPTRTALINPLSGIAAVMAHGTLALIHNPLDNQRTPLAISLSSNSGQSWTSTSVLDSAQFEVSYPAFILGRDKMVRGVYTFNRRMIKYIAFPASLLRHGAG